jgi:hypothetical protein
MEPVVGRLFLDGSDDASIERINLRLNELLTRSLSVYVVVVENDTVGDRFRSELILKGIPYLIPGDADKAVTHFDTKREKSLRVQSGSLIHGRAWLTYPMLYTMRFPVLIVDRSDVFIRHMISVGATIVTIGKVNTKETNLKFDTSVEATQWVSRVTESYGKSEFVDLRLFPGFEATSFGRVLRDNVILAFEANECVFLGSEVETISAMARLGVYSECVAHTSLRKPYVLSDFRGRKGDSPIHLGDGQRKLLAVNFPLLTRHDIDSIVIIGASPGTHLNDVDLTDFNVITIDPSKPDFLGSTHISKKIEDVKTLESIIFGIVEGNYVVISDIRSEKVGDEKADEDAINDDNQLQFDWLNMLVKDDRCKFVSLKFRPSRNFDMVGIPLSCDVILQPWVRGSSKETRLFIDTSILKTIDYASMSRTKYERMVNNWNYERSIDPTLNTKQETLLRTYFYTRTADFKRYDVKGRVAVALFAASDVQNDKVDVFNWLSRLDRYIVTLPNINVLRASGGSTQHGVKFVEPDIMSMELRPKRGFVVVALPAGSGKSTLSKKYGWLDVDDSRNEELEKVLRPLQIKKDWETHNKIWYDNIAQWLNDKPFNILLAHGIDVSQALLERRVPVSDVIAAKTDIETMERVADERAKEDAFQGEITRLNWNDHPGPIVGDHEEVEKWILVRIGDLNLPVAFSDFAYAPEELPGYSYSPAQFIYSLTHDVRGERLFEPEDRGTVGMGFFTKLWMIHTKGILNEDGVEDIAHTQGNLTKFYTSIVRQEFQLDNNSLHRFRRQALEERGGIVILEGSVIHGMLDGVKISVSGHLVNLMLVSHMWTVDLKRYLMAVYTNVAHRFGSKSAKRDVAISFAAGELVEEELYQRTKDKNFMWHSYMDYVIAVDTYKLIATAWYGGFNHSLVDFVLLELDSINSGFPKWRSTEGFLVSGNRV